MKLCGASVAVVVITVATATTMDAKADDVIAATSAKWWELVFSVPPADNPLADTTGKNCMVGQRGKVWYLFGNSSGTTNRTCTVPQDRQLFIVIYSHFELNTPNVCGQGAAFDVATARATAAGYADSASGLHIRLDGRSLDGQIVRSASRVFDGTFPADNIYNAPCASSGGFPAGVYSPGAADGYYVLLHQLGVGAHKLSFHATAPDVGSINVTYTLNIASVSHR